MEDPERIKAKYDVSAYRPILIVALVALLGSFALQVSRGPVIARWWMHDFMGLFLLIFAMFKLFDVEGFAEGFAMYDIIAAGYSIQGTAPLYIRQVRLFPAPAPP